MSDRLGRGPSFLVHVDGAEHDRGDAFSGPNDPEGPHRHKCKGPSQRVTCLEGEDPLAATIREVFDSDNFFVGLEPDQLRAVTPELLIELEINANRLCRLSQ